MHQPGLPSWAVGAVSLPPSANAVAGWVAAMVARARVMTSRGTIIQRNAPDIAKCEFSSLTSILVAHLSKLPLMLSRFLSDRLLWVSRAGLGR